MISRAELKMKAKQALTNNYWMAFLVCLVSGIIMGGINFTYQYGNGSIRSRNIHNFIFHPAILIFILMIVLISIIAGMAYSLFISLPINVGKTKYFLDNRNGYSKLDTIFYSFRSGHYLNVVASLAWRALFEFLWTLLFIIPGIIKFYSYFMVPYILSDNPNIGYKRALQLSMDMTEGYKFQIFVLQLSFLGWYLLGLLCCGIGVLFVAPYYEATIAEMYITVRDNALANGLCSFEELNLYPNNNNNNNNNQIWQ